MQKIMFNDRYGLTQAVIEGRKTMTRRLISREFFTLNWDTRGDTLVYENAYGDFIDIRDSKYCPYKVGDVVAVSQSYESIAIKHPDVDTFLHQLSKACGCELEDIPNLPGWNNKMFTRGELMPYRIRITGVRCERLQDISDEDCMKEGIYWDYADTEFPPHEFYDYDWNEDNGFNTPREAFASLIDKVSGKGTWDRNPWVVVYEFELVK